MRSPRHSGCSGRVRSSSVMSWSTPTAAGATTRGSGDGSSDIPTECFPWSPTDHEPQREHWRGAWLWHAAKLVLKLSMVSAELCNPAQPGLIYSCEFIKNCVDKFVHFAARVLDFWISGSSRRLMPGFRSFSARLHASCTHLTIS